MKSLRDISLNITEADYRKDGCMHQSTLATYEREGFYKLSKLFDEKKSESLTFGSMVDLLTLSGKEEFDKQFMVVDLPSIPEAAEATIAELFKLYCNIYESLDNIPDEYIATAIEVNKYQLNWKPETRVKNLKEKYKNYYRLLYLAKGKTIVSTDTYLKAQKCVTTLLESEATKFLFQKDNPFDENVQRFSQLIFKSTFDGIDYSIMIDKLVVLHDKKIIIPIDLKTSWHNEGEFYKSFIDWGYFVQARQYYQVLRDNLDRDDFYKDYNLLNWHFVVVNKDNLTPLVWEYKDTKELGTLYYGKNKEIVCRHPFDIAKELKYYLDNKPKVPNGISLNKPNDIVEWINREM